MARLVHSREVRLREAERVAARIIADVRRRGDRALIAWTRKLDGVRISAADLAVSSEEIGEARRAADPKLVRALRRAARNIRAVARRQIPAEFSIETERGIEVGEWVRPLGRVACYVPGGRFPLPSTVLMSVIPAQAAGVREIAVTSPRPAPAVLVAADILGIRTIYRLGGAQAIAAFAYGTETIPRADKIVGPGNRYVAAAKKLVAGDCGIDFVAGPTELVIIGDRGHPEWVAWDLIAQAEHDPDALALLLTASRPFARAVQQALRGICASGSIAERTLEGRCGIIVARNLESAAEISNDLAPEHLMLLDGTAQWFKKITSAGSIFLGGASAVAAGDYATGGNHILPTSGAARMRGGLTAADFTKVIGYQRAGLGGLARLRPTLTTLARTEGLEGHARSIEVRFERAARQALESREAKK